MFLFTCERGLILHMLLNFFLVRINILGEEQESFKREPLKKRDFSHWNNQSSKKNKDYPAKIL